jgi:T-complex protein 1 subunit theta
VCSSDLAEDLLKNGLHTAEVVAGYQKAYQKALEILPTLAIKSLNDIRNPKELTECIRSVIATKQFGYEDFLSNLVTEACLTTISPTAKNPKINIDSIRISKIRGSTVPNSSVVKGMIILRDAEGIIKRAENAKVIVFGTGIEASATEAKGTVLIKNATELLNYNKSEERKMEELIEAIAATGVKVVVANGTISEMALHFLDKFSIMVVKIASKFDLRRICQAIGATPAVRLGPVTPEEMGECSLVEVKEVAGRKITVFEQKLDEDTSVATIIVRASTENVANDVERAIDDGVRAVKALSTDPRLLPGAGAVELELSKRLKAYADESKGLDQYGIRKFAEAFEVVPRTLVENSGCDSTDLLAQLHLSHLTPGNDNIGFNVEDNIPFDVKAAGVYDIYITKLNALRLAVDAAITVLRVDQIVMSKPAGGPKAPKNAAMDDM